jgi:hypothetical protein
MMGLSHREPLFHIASQWLLGMLLALILTGLFLSISAFQLTARGTGTRILQRAVAAITDIDALLPQLQQDLREAADSSEEETITVPSFPIPIELPREEASELDTQELRQRLLEEGADMVYEQGLGVLAAADPEAQRDIELISTASLLDRGLGLITEDNHSRLRITTVLLAFLASILAVLLMSTVASYGRLVVAGTVVLAASLPFLAAAVATRFGFRAAQEEAGPFPDALLELGVDALWVPIRDYLALAALGGALLALGIGFLWLAARGQTAASVDRA